MRKSTLIRHSLTRGPRTVAQLAQETGLSCRDVDAKLNRMRHRGKVVPRRHDDGRFRGWGLS